MEGVQEQVQKGWGKKKTIRQLCLKSSFWFFSVRKFISKYTTALTFEKLSVRLYLRLCLCLCLYLCLAVSVSVPVPVPVSVPVSVPVCQARGALRCLARDDEQNRAFIAQSIENL